MKVIWKKTLLKTLLFLACIIAGSWNVYAETFFVYVEEVTISKETLDAPAIREGLLGGLFEKGHIVFDDLEIANTMDWEKANFKTVINKALVGGARYMVAIKATTKSTTVDAGQLKLEHTARYYFFDVEKVQLIKEGEISKANVITLSDFDPIETGFIFGNELSFLLNDIWEKIPELEGRKIKTAKAEK
jgi:hypothetical protein